MLAPKAKVREMLNQIPNIAEQETPTHARQMAYAGAFPIILDLATHAKHRAWGKTECSKHDKARGKHLDVNVKCQFLWKH